MSSNRGCKCLTCESIGAGSLDYRDHLSPQLEKPCVLCALKWESDAGCKPRVAVERRFYIPDPVREFLGGALCQFCIISIDWQMTRAFRACWATASPELMRLAVLVVLRHTLTSAIYFRGPKIVAEQQALSEWRAEMEKRRAEEEKIIDIPICPRIRRRDIDA